MRTRVDSTALTARVPTRGSPAPLGGCRLLLRALGCTPAAGPRRPAWRSAAALVAGGPPASRAGRCATVLVGQAVLGWHNDLVDRERDAAAGAERQAARRGQVSAGNAWFAVACARPAVVPLSLQQRRHRRGGATCAAGRGRLSASASCAVRRCRGCRGRSASALLPAFLSYGGWGGGGTAARPRRPCGAGRAARGRRALAARRCRTWSPTTGRAAPPAAAARAQDRRHRGCWSSRSRWTCSPWSSALGHAALTVGLRQ